MNSARERGVRGGAQIGRPALPSCRRVRILCERDPLWQCPCPALSAPRCALPPRFCKILQRWGRVCPRPSPSLGCAFYLFIYLFSTQVRHRYQKRHSLRRTFRRRRRPHGGGHDRGDSRIREHRSPRRKDHPHHPNPHGDPLAACPASGHCATHPRALDRAPRQEHIASPPPDPRRRAESFPPSPAPSTPPCPATSWRQPIAPALRRNIPAPVPA